MYGQLQKNSGLTKPIRLFLFYRNCFCARVVDKFYLQPLFFILRRIRSPTVDRSKARTMSVSEGGVAGRRPYKISIKFTF